MPTSDDSYDGWQTTNAWGDERSSSHDAFDLDVFETSRAHRIIAWTVAALTLGYMLPWALAVQRNMPRHRSLGILNLALGWTGLGWILAMIEVLLWRPTRFWRDLDAVPTITR